MAQHLIRTVSASRLMGADCIISGIRPQIAQTIVHLELQLDVVSKATMADAFALALAAATLLRAASSRLPFGVSAGWRPTLIPIGGRRSPSRPRRTVARGRKRAEPRAGCSKRIRS